MRQRWILALLASVSVLVVAGPGVALAAWVGAGTGRGYSRAVSMPTGNTPTVSLNGRNAAVSWAASTLPGPTPVSGYVVSRFDTATNTSQTVGASCSGTIAGLTCTEAAVPPGTWYYKVAAKKGAWLGARSAASSNITVASPSLTFSSSTTLSTLPSTLNGTIASYITGETITFRLDNPSSGTILTGSATPSSIPAGGGAAISVTIPTGTTNGAHTVYAIGSVGTQASAGITVAVDIAAPTISSLTIAKTTGYRDAYIKAGGTYYVYANVSDAAPSSGIASVTANVNNITAGSTTVAMVAGSYSINGTSYNYRTASLTAGAGLTAGAKTFSVTATDNVALNSTVNGSVTVDNTVPAATDIQSANTSGGTTGKIEVNDTWTYTFNDPIDPESVLTGWTGAGTAVTLRLTNAGPGDYVLVYNAANTTLLPINRVSFGNKNYLTSSGTGTGTMTMTGSTITIQITGLGAAGTQIAAATTMSWIVNAGMYDRAGNACAALTVNQAGGPKVNF